MRGMKKASQRGLSKSFYNLMDIPNFYRESQVVRGYLQPSPSNLHPFSFILSPSAFSLTVITLCAMLYALGEGLNRNSQLVTCNIFSHPSTIPSFHLFKLYLLRTVPKSLTEKLIRFPWFKKQFDTIKNLPQAL